MKKNAFSYLLGCLVLTNASTASLPFVDQIPELKEVAATVANEHDPYHEWIKKVYQRVVAFGEMGRGGSGVIWKTQTAGGLPIVITANHVARYQPEKPNEELPSLLSEPHRPALKDRIILRTDSVGWSHPKEKPYIFQHFFNQAVAAGLRHNDLPPRQDFAIGFLIQALPPLTPREIETSVSKVMAGQPILIIGFPQEDAEERMAYSIGQVLTDRQAREQLTKRTNANQVNPPYDSEAEFLISAPGMRGMSGGGAFDQDGHLVGIAVRSSETKIDGMYVTRIVRLEYIFNALYKTLSKLPAEKQNEIFRFLN